MNVTQLDKDGEKRREIWKKKKKIGASSWDVFLSSLMTFHIRQGKTGDHLCCQFDAFPVLKTKKPSRWLSSMHVFVFRYVYISRFKIHVQSTTTQVYIEPFSFIKASPSLRLTGENKRRTILVGRGPFICFKINPFIIAFTSNATF